MTLPFSNFTRLVLLPKSLPTSYLPTKQNDKTPTRSTGQPGVAPCYPRSDHTTVLFLTDLVSVRSTHFKLHSQVLLIMGSKIYTFMNIAMLCFLTKLKAMLFIRGSKIGTFMNLTMLCFLTKLNAFTVIDLNLFPGKQSLWGNVKLCCGTF